MTRAAKGRPLCALRLQSLCRRPGSEERGGAGGRPGRPRAGRGGPWLWGAGRDGSGSQAAGARRRGRGAGIGRRETNREWGARAAQAEGRTAGPERGVGVRGPKHRDPARSSPGGSRLSPSSPAVPAPGGATAEWERPGLPRPEYRGPPGRQAEERRGTSPVSG